MSMADYWMKLDGIEGESSDEKMEKAFQIESWAWSEKNAGSWATNNGGGSGKVMMEDFTFSMPFNKAAPKLFAMCAGGDHIASGELVCRKGGGGQQVYLKVKFSDFIISSFEIRAEEGGGDGYSGPKVSFSINFAKMDIDYQEQKPDGSVGATTTAGYDLRKNAKS